MVCSDLWYYFLKDWFGSKSGMEWYLSDASGTLGGGYDVAIGAWVEAQAVSTRNPRNRVGFLSDEGINQVLHCVPLPWPLALSQHWRHRPHRKSKKKKNRERAELLSSFSHFMKAMKICNSSQPRRKRAEIIREAREIRDLKGSFEMREREDAYAFLCQESRWVMSMIFTEGRVING